MSYLAVIGIGPTEWLIIGGVVLLLFGARKLPDLARAMGSSVSQFKKGMTDSGKDEEKPAGGTPPTQSDAAPRSKDH